MNWLVSQNKIREVQDEAAIHRKKLALILRYIASMHQSSDNSNSNNNGSASSSSSSSGAGDISFVREYANNEDKETLLETDFFQGDKDDIDIDTNGVNDENVLFSISDFRRLVENDCNMHDSNPGTSSLFSFYASSSSSAFPSHSSSSISLFSNTSQRSYSSNDNDGGTCWLRLTRLPKNPKPIVPNRGVVHNYLCHWASIENINDYNDLLTLQKIHTAPKLAPGAANRDDVQSFLRKCKKYLRREKVRRVLEPIYNRLFEWMSQQQGRDEVLIWGLGNARMVHQGKVVNGPLLEVMVEVELARDGALLIRPRGHTGVSLNREVVSFLGSEGSSRVSDLHRTTSEMETSQISPGQPNTYSGILKRIAFELSPGGKFQQSSSGIDDSVNFDSLIVTGSWCLYRRLKPRTLWARDASALEERLLLNEDEIMNVPKAAYALTHGPGYFAQFLESNSTVTQTFNTKQNSEGNSVFGSLKSAIFGKSNFPKNECTPALSTRPLFPLPTSEVQTRIADLMLNKNYPAVVCEGPPGTGKTHTIANIICAYLCRGKRVLITSKGSPALSVLRNRLPKSVQDLCVDVSMSETAGMRQLQQTVEQLADKVSRVSSDIELEKCQLIQRRIDAFQQELSEINNKLELHSDRKRKIILSQYGQQLVDEAMSLLQNAPWLMKTFTSWTIVDVREIQQRVDSLLIKEDDDLNLVSNYMSPPDDTLINRVAIEAGETFPCIKNTAFSAISSMPILGGIISNNSSKNDEQLTDRMNDIKVNDRHPCDKNDWQLVLRALRHDKEIHAFHNEVSESFKWPIDEVYEICQQKRRVKASLLACIDQVIRIKDLASKLDLKEENGIASEIAALDCRRSKITEMMQHLSEELVEATIVTELSRMFSPEAQSALIKFSQIACKAKFNKSSSTQGKMSQRQRRHRQEYLNCFEQCVRYIPCWILTSSQINDYLPPEFGLFDLVIIDEASQSDATVLPGMLRGKQWLIVGDGKQVSPGEMFISENQINSLRAALPESPLEDSLLPGHSFFDLSAQCFPCGRVVLREHFRSAPEIIKFSNEEFYGSKLIPLRLPTRSERMVPSVVDVRVEGVKFGKVNEKECDTIVSMVQEMILETRNDIRRSIGIISLVGNEQSRLIRGRLLDRIGPQKYKEHNILVGDPPTFQGAERDCIFLSMVCSQGNVPTQSQLMHAQRANVALSRARDRMVLVRSIDISHISNADDIKIPIIEFFTEDKTSRMHTRVPLQKCVFSLRLQMQHVIEARLQAQGFATRQMGIVLEDATSVECQESGKRVAICVVCAGESNQEWLSMLLQQKSIERVGWNCMRVDALNCLLDFESSFKSVVKFLASVGVKAAKLSNDLPIEENSIAVQNIVVVEENAEEAINDDVSQLESIFVVSDEEESLQPASSQSIKTEAIETEPSALQSEQFGDEVDLGFLRRRSSPESSVNTSDDLKEDCSTLASSKRRRKYRRLDKHSRDGRYYPGPDVRDSRDEDNLDFSIL